MPQSFASLHCHIVLSTKHRQPLIQTNSQSRLFEYIGGILRNHSCSLVDAGGMPDHVHLLVSMGRTIAVADAVRFIKANSSAWLHAELAIRDFQWQAGFGAFAVSYSNIDAVRMYLANQEEHHRMRSFQDDFRELLRRLDLEWDEQYVWD